MLAGTFNYRIESSGSGDVNSFHLVVLKAIERCVKCRMRVDHKDICLSGLRDQLRIYIYHPNALFGQVE